MNKKKFISILMVLLLFAAPSAALAFEGYQALLVSIPFSFHHNTEIEHDCTVQIEYDASAPKPDADVKTIQNGGKGSFDISVTAPGVYQYKIYEVKGTDEDLIYDDTIYWITIYVINSEKSGELSYTITAESSQTGAKPEVIEFRNVTAGENTTGETATIEINDRGTGRSVKTGDNMPLGALAAVLVVSAAGILWILLRKRKKDNNEEKEKE